ncbi:hypothetical protein [Mesorhizobium sp. M0598]
MKRAVFFHERGELRDRSFESQAFRGTVRNSVREAMMMERRESSHGY